MTDRMCSLDDCSRPHAARGWCTLHYWRWRRTGDPLVKGRVRVLSPAIREARFWDKVQKQDDRGCWIWTGFRSDAGYGQFTPGDTRVPVGAHRYAYTLTVGSIPDGFHVDHLCRNRACVNPAHLEAVTPHENNRRSSSPTALNARKTHCKNGHEFTPENTYRVPEGRHCRECGRETVRRYRKRKAALA